MEHYKIQVSKRCTSRESSSTMTEKDYSSSSSVCSQRSSLSDVLIKITMDDVAWSRDKSHHVPSYYSKEYQKCLPVAPVFRRQPWVIRVRAYKNGTISVPVRVAASTMHMLLLECTVKLNLNMAARRVFLEDGTEALEPKDIPHDSDVYISTGEPFLDPCKRIKEHLILMENVTWSMDGLVLPIDAKRGKTKPALSKRMKELSRKPESRMLVFRNGTGEDGCEMFAAQNGMQKL